MPPTWRNRRDYPDWTRGLRHSRNGSYGTSARIDRHQSALMPAARITLPHFSVSSAMSFPKSAGEPASNVLPLSGRRAFDLGSESRPLNLGSASPALTALLSLPMISAGVFFGAPMPPQKLAS